MSSTKAKIMAGSLAALEAVYLRNLLLDLGQRIGLPTDLYVDNKGAMTSARTASPPTARSTDYI